MDRILLDITCILLNFKNIQVAKMYGKMAHFTCIKAQEVNILISKTKRYKCYIPCRTTIYSVY